MNRYEVEIEHIDYNGLMVIPEKIFIIRNKLNDLIIYDDSYDPDLYDFIQKKRPNEPVRFTKISYRSGNTNIVKYYTTYGHSYGCKIFNDYISTIGADIHNCRAISYMIKPMKKGDYTMGKKTKFDKSAINKFNIDEVLKSVEDRPDKKPKKKK